MTALDQQSPGMAQLPEVPPAIAFTYSSRTLTPGNVDLCLALTWLDGDPMPIICARAKHEADPRHLTARAGGCGTVLQFTWNEPTDVLRELSAPKKETP